MARQANALAIALGGRPDPAVYTALGKTPQEAAQMAYQAVRARREAAALARHGFTP